MNNATLTDRVVLSTRDIGSVLGISPGAVRMRIVRQQLPAYKLGRRYVFLREEFEAYLHTLPRVGMKSLSG